VHPLAEEHHSKLQKYAAAMHNRPPLLYILHTVYALYITLSCHFTLMFLSISEWAVSRLHL